MRDLLLRLERDSDVSLRDQLIAQLREAVLSGGLEVGHRLPPTRQLAAELGLARLTVVDCYEQLVAEGYLQARVGAGTFVALATPSAPSGPVVCAHAPVALHASAWARRLRAEPPPSVPAGGRPEFDFRPGVGAWDQFAVERWLELSEDVWREASADDLWYGDPLGPLPLRKALCSWLGRSRAVRSSPDQVAITTGAQQAVALLARLVLDPGDTACLENPGYPRTRDLLLSEGVRLHALEVDAHGVQPESLPASAALVQVTPSHQYPLGGTLPIARRLALLDWARTAGTLIVEDDYDGELALGGHRLPSLQGLDQAGCVAYVGTFSKALFPSLRLGFVVLPPSLVDGFRRARAQTERQPPWHEAATLARFIESGEFERHVARLRRVYRERRDVLFASLAAELGESVRVGPCETGAHVTLRLPGQCDDELLVRRLEDAGVGAAALSSYYVRAPEAGLVLGFGGISTSVIPLGVHRLAEVLLPRRSGTRPGNPPPLASSSRSTPRSVRGRRSSATAPLA